MNFTLFLLIGLLLFISYKLLVSLKDNIYNYKKEKEFIITDDTKVIVMKKIISYIKESKEKSNLKIDIMEKVDKKDKDYNKELVNKFDEYQNYNSKKSKSVNIIKKMMEKEIKNLSKLLYVKKEN